MLVDLQNKYQLCTLHQQTAAAKGFFVKLFSSKYNVCFSNWHLGYHKDLYAVGQVCH